MKVVESPEEDLIEMDAQIESMFPTDDKVYKIADVVAVVLELMTIVQSQIFTMEYIRNCLEVLTTHLNDLIETHLP